MLFNSINFLFFLPTVFLLYWFAFQKELKLQKFFIVTIGCIFYYWWDMRFLFLIIFCIGINYLFGIISAANKDELKLQNFFILTVSYIFYLWWDLRFLLLIIICSGINYLAGFFLAANDNQQKRKLILTTACILNLGLLCVFKYFNFFVDNFISAFTSIGIHLQARTWNIILPVGISFYTFKALSYTIDVYKRKLEPKKDIIAFFSFVAFFPQLLAGPIDRATNLLPQFYVKRTFEYDKAVDGMRQMLWGFFKKIVVADNCAIIVNNIFNNYQTMSASTLLVGAVYFSFQIYCDFSGYSDIAIGCARLFGFNSMQNFAYPYFSRDIAEFWRRWHISLTSWFRDYLYIPLGGSRGTWFRTIRNTFIIFLVCGIWHGANWTFIAWGFINAVYFLPLLILGKNRRHLDNVARGRILPGIREVVQMAITFVITTFAWIFFRADSISQALSYINHIFSKSLFSLPTSANITSIIPAILLVVSVEWLQRDKPHGLDLQNVNIPSAARWLIYYVLILLILYFGSGEQTFIYFKF